MEMAVGIGIGVIIAVVIIIGGFYLWSGIIARRYCKTIEKTWEDFGNGITDSIDIFTNSITDAIDKFTDKISVSTEEKETDEGSYTCTKVTFNDNISVESKSELKK